MNTFEMTASYILDTYRRYPLSLEKGKGCYVYDESGVEYLDMAAGIAVSSLGHSHKKIIHAIKKQSHKLIHTSNLYYNKPSAKMAKSLIEISGFSKVFFSNSGAEANEAAIKIARKYGKHNGKNEKHIIISFNKSFHGRTMATISATGQPKYQEPFTPLLPGILYADYNSIESVEKIMNDNVCAVIIEPLQGEGGVHEANFDFMVKLRKLCNKHDAVLIFDEIQTGVGRTGTMFAYEHFSIKPDIVTLAKGIAGGLPMGTTLVNDKLSNVLVPGDHASTFGGNLLSSAVGHTVLKTIENDKLLENTRKNGAYFINKLKKLQKEYPLIITDVRGRGLLIGIEITYPSSELVTTLIENKIITVPAGTNVVRFLPPLIVNKKQIDVVISKLSKIFKKRN